MCEQVVPGEILAREAEAHGPAGGMKVSSSGPGGAAGEQAAAQPELAEARERYLRLAAEFENFKKRSARESERRAAAQKEGFIRELLPAVDNLERALTNGRTLSAEQLREGVELTLRQLGQVLSRHGYAGSDDLGQPFDPKYHEAVSVRSEPTHPDHTILEIWQRGWLRGKEMFRPAKVVVNDLSHDVSSGQRETIQHEKGPSHV